MGMQTGCAFRARLCQSQSSGLKPVTSTEQLIVEVYLGGGVALEGGRSHHGHAGREQEPKHRRERSARRPWSVGRGREHRLDLEGHFLEDGRCFLGRQNREVPGVRYNGRAVGSNRGCLGASMTAGVVSPPPYTRFVILISFF